MSEHPKVIQIADGEDYTLFLLSDGTVWHDRKGYTKTNWTQIETPPPTRGKNNV